MSVKYITNIVFTSKQLSRRLSLFINAIINIFCILMGFWATLFSILNCYLNFIIQNILYQICIKVRILSGYSFGHDYKMFWIKFTIKLIIIIDQMIRIGVSGSELQVREILLFPLVTMG